MTASMPRSAADGAPMSVLQRVNKWYGDFHVLKDIDLSVEAGEKIVICGPSGSGKSTMSRCINALEAHQKGRITVNGIQLTNDLKHVIAGRSEIGMGFEPLNLIQPLHEIGRAHV